MHGRSLGLFSRVLFLFILLILSFVFVDVRTGPGVNAAAIALCNFRIVTRLGFQLDGAVFGDVEDQLLVEHGAGFGKVIFHPELPGRERRLRDRDEVVLQFFSRAQPRHSDVFLPIVGINRSISLQRNA